MATGTILDMFNPQTAEVIGTPRTERIANEPFDVQIRNAGMSVLDALLASARDQVVAIASGTEVGQNLIANDKLFDWLRSGRCCRTRSTSPWRPAA